MFFYPSLALVHFIQIWLDIQFVDDLFIYWKESNYFEDGNPNDPAIERNRNSSIRRLLSTVNDHLIVNGDWFDFRIVRHSWLRGQRTRSRYNYLATVDDFNFANKKMDVAFVHSTRYAETEMEGVSLQSTRATRCPGRARARSRLNKISGLVILFFDFSRVKIWPKDVGAQELKNSGSCRWGSITLLEAELNSIRLLSVADDGRLVV